MTAPTDRRRRADHRPDPSAAYREDQGHSDGAADHPGPGPDAAPRHDRRPRTPGGSTGLRMTIGVKLGALTGALVAILVVASTLLIAESRSSSAAYNRVLDVQVAQALKARQMQVEFKKQVQEWKDILLRGSNPADLATYTGNFHAEDLRVGQLNADMLASSPDPQLKAQLTRFRDAHRQLDLDYAKALAAFQAADEADPKVPDKMVRGLDRPPTDLLDGMVASLETQSSDAVARQESLTTSHNRTTLVVGGLALIALVAMLVLAVLRIVRPIRRLTREAFAVATERLPGAIDAVRTMEPGAEPPALPPFQAGTTDELQDLGEAFTSLQNSAMQLAVDQHRADRETADMLVNLGRRNQNLLGRMLGYVTELERREQNPETLSQLFQLDHATTRIRRNAESMLVLAGANQTRTWSRPVPVIDVVRAALSEIEEFIRVDLHHMEDAMVNGSAVADVVHLVAELVENATHFSPPTTQVTVIGQRIREGYRLRVIDQGVGMTRRELDDANRRIQNSGGGWSDTKLLGLYVVGRLARRRSIQVVLEPSAGRGITATILVPLDLLGVASDAASSGVLPSAAALLEGRNGDEPSTSSSGSGARREPVGAPSMIDLTGADAREGLLVPAGVPVEWLDAPAAPAQARYTPPDVPPSSPAPRSVPAPTSPVGRFSVPPPVYAPPPDQDPPEPAMPVSRTAVSPAPVSPAPLPPAPLSPAQFSPAPLSPAPLSPAVSHAPFSPAPFSAPVSPTPRPPVAAAPAPVVPRRVRGAQLPDLGPTDEPIVARPDEGPGAPESLRWQLRSFQLDVQAARRAIAEAGDDLPTRPDLYPDAMHPDEVDRADEPTSTQRRPEADR